jgi:hypothetical protein
MNKSTRVLSGILVIVLAIVVGYFAGIQKQSSPDDIASSTSRLLTPTQGEEWRVGEVHTINWKPGDEDAVSLTVINPSFGEGYRFHLCASLPPYPCQLPNTGEFQWTIPADDGHNEWGASAEYQIVLSLSPGSEPLSTSDKFSITAEREITKPPAPGPFVADAVRNLSPKSLKVGDNDIDAEVRGYMFFEGVTHLKLYDGMKEIDLGVRTDGIPNTVVLAEGEWMTEGYVPVKHTISIPAALKGKTLVIRFIADDPRDDARPRYWGTLIRVD